MTCSNEWQADFDELISCSLAALEPPQECYASTTSKCASGIDSFLAGYRQMNSKANFGKLIQCSLASLEPLQPRNLGPSLKSSGSIDDFLAEYRHESTSIVSFLSCFEEPPRKDPASNNTTRLDAALSLESELECKEQQPLKTLMDREIGQSDPIDGKEKVASTSSRKRTRVSQPHSESSRKVARTKAHNESKEERRRIKNCEYQRRFRERRLRLEMQQLWMATCARHVTFL